MQLRPVQTFMAQKVLAQIAKQTNHEMIIDRVKISWLDQASFENILIKDLEGDTLVYTKNLTVNYEIKHLINGDYLNVEEISSEELRLKLVKYDSAEKLNLSIFISSLQNDTTKKESKSIRVSNIELQEFDLSLQDLSKTPDPSRLDFSNLHFNIPNLTLADFSLKTDTISGKLLQMHGTELNSNFRIEEFTTLFSLSNQSLSVDNLNFNTPTSHVSDSLEFFYNGLDDFGYFVDSVSFILHFNKTRISQQDFEILTGSDEIKADLTIDGTMQGKVGDFNIEDTRFGYGDSYIMGEVSCFGLPDIDGTFILADLTDSHLLPRDLRPYIGDFEDNLRQMGKIDFTGSFAGFIKDFVARGDFITNQGSIHTDINIKIPEDPSEMSYTGNLEFINVNVGAFLKNDILQQVNLQASIDGRGINLENAEFEAEALIYNSGLKGYIYDSIQADGQFAKNFFEGTFYVKDPNCDVVGNAEIDLRKEVEVLDLDARISTLNANFLNLTAQNLSARGKIDLTLTDIDIDSFSADLNIDSALVSIDNQNVLLDSIRFDAFYQDSTRVVKLAFPGLMASVIGDFKVSDILKDVPVMAAGYTSKLQLNKDTSILETSGNNYKVEFYAQIDDISNYLDSLDLPVSLGGETSIEASFRQSKNANISLFAETDSLSFSGNLLVNPIIEINGSKDLEAGGILTNFIFESQEQVIKGIPNTQNLLVEGIWFDYNIDLTTQIEQPATHTDLRIQSNLKLSEDSIVLHMEPSDITILDDNWKFNPINKVIVTSKKTEISNFEIFDSSESITISGVYADSIPTSIQITTEDLEMDKVSLFSNAHIGGFLNGSFEIFRNSDREAFKFDGGFLLKNLFFDELKIGDISGSSKWDPSKESIYSEVQVERENFNAMEAKGYYYPLREKGQLDFDVTFEKAELKMGQPFLAENFSEIDGTANGKLKISGSTLTPRVVGSCRIKDGNVIINYLNTRYRFNGKIDFDPSEIRFSDFALRDRKGSNAFVSGSIKHSSFNDFITALNIRASNFEFLNTTILDNSLYYGSAYGTGTIDVSGPLNDLYIRANMKTESDTRFFVPISENTEVGQEDYITFIDLTDTTKFEEQKDFDISGVTMEFDLDITPDAYCELIFDQKTGDIIQGRGRGNLKLRLSSDGEFNMFGGLEIEDGAYNFTPNLGGTALLSKNFQVVPGSSISWFGDAYNATLNLEATYLQRASFENLDSPEEQQESELNNRVPVLVVLDLTGAMLNPEIDFDIRLQDPADANEDINEALTRVRSDEQELSRQVISLLFLKRFTPRESFFTSNQGFSVSRSVSEVLSNQLSYLASQVDENLELEIDLADFDRDAFNTFQLRFAYTFLDGRLRVSRGGDFGNDQDANENVLNDIVGDWSVEYSLTRDGRLRAKVFRNTTQQLPVASTGQNQETGISLKFVHSFNDLTDLLSLKREAALIRRKEEEQDEFEEEPKEDEDTSR